MMKFLWREVINYYMRYVMLKGQHMVSEMPTKESKDGCKSTDAEGYKLLHEDFLFGSRFVGKIALYYT